MAAERQSVMEAGGKLCRIYAEEAPEYVMIQPTGTHERDSVEDTVEMILQNTDRRICFVSFPISDWNRELSPWKARQAYGEAYFGDGAAVTLKTISESVIPALRRHIRIPDSARYILGGYSLAGMFSLWCAYQTDLFYAVAACSPSVWIDGWQAYADGHVPLTQRVCLSLGTKEHKTRNPMLQTVKQAVVHQYEQMQRQGILVSLAWNAGNHFQDCAKRMGNAFLQTISTNEESGGAYENNSGCSGGDL